MWIGREAMLDGGASVVDQCLLRRFTRGGALVTVLCVLHLSVIAHDLTIHLGQVLRAEG